MLSGWKFGWFDTLVLAKVLVKTLVCFIEIPYDVTSILEMGWSFDNICLYFLLSLFSPFIFLVISPPSSSDTKLGAAGSSGLPDVAMRSPTTSNPSSPSHRAVSPYQATPYSGSYNRLRAGCFTEMSEKMANGSWDWCLRWGLNSWMGSGSILSKWWYGVSIIF